MSAPNRLEALVAKHDGEHLGQRCVIVNHQHPATRPWTLGCFRHWHPFGHCDMDTDIGGGQTRDDLMTLRLCDVILCTLKTSFTTLTRSRSGQWASCEFWG